MASLLPAYVELLEQLKGLGVPEVQIHEPILTVHKADKLQSNFEKTYAEFAKIGLAIDLVTYYDDIGSTFQWVTKLPVQVKLTSPLAGAGSQSIQKHMGLNVETHHSSQIMNELQGSITVQVAEHI